MRWRLRQVTTLVGDIDAAIDELEQELGLSVSLRDDGTTAAANGISNAWVPLGSSIFEVASPARPGDATSRFHERFGDGGYMIILQTNDLEAAEERLRSLGVRVTWEIDRPEAHERHLDHRDVGGTILAVDCMASPGLWPWAGPDWPSHVRTHVVTELLCAEVHTPDPATVAARWGDILERAPVCHGDAHELHLDRGVVRFLPSDDHGRGRLTGIEVGAAPGRPTGGTQRVAGLDVRFVPSIEPVRWWEE